MNDQGISFIALGLLGVLIFSLVYMRYLKMQFPYALGLSIVGMMVAAGALAATKGEVLHPTRWHYDEVMAGIGWAVMVMTGLGLAGKLYRAWILDLATDAEREPNGKGVRAWLGVGNLIMAVLFVGAGYVARWWDPVAIMAAVIGLLLAYPLTNCLLKGGTGPVGHEREELAEERRRVLAMVESGKISAEDGAELIGALGQSGVVARETGVKLTGNRRVVMLGAALVVVGFCLPWFTVNLGQKMQEAMGSMQQGMPAGMAVPEGFPVPTMTQTVLEVRGGDVQHGIGWIILLMAAAVAVMPVVWVALAEQRDAQRSATLVGMLAGTVLVMYLAASFYRDMNAGMVLVMAGYAVMWVGVVREYLRPQGAMVAVAG